MKDHAALYLDCALQATNALRFHRATCASRGTMSLEASSITLSEDMPQVLRLLLCWTLLAPDNLLYLDLEAQRVCLHAEGMHHSKQVAECFIDFPVRLPQSRKGLPAADRASSQLS